MRTIILTFIFAGILASNAQASDTTYFSSEVVNHHITILRDSLLAARDPVARISVLEAFKKALRKDLRNHQIAPLDSVDFAEMNTFQGNVNAIKLNHLNSENCKAIDAKLISANTPPAQGDEASALPDDSGTRTSFLVWTWLCEGY